MELYSKNGNLDTSGFMYYNEGSCAKVYKQGQMLLKAYKIDCKYWNMINLKLFQRIKEANIPHMLKLYDYYYAEKSFWNYILGMEAYTMGYAGERIPSLIHAKTEYLLDMIADLEKILPELCKNKILLNDTHYGNIIFSENNVTIIDPDRFYLVKHHGYDYILKKNKEAIVDYVISTMVHELIQSKKDELIIHTPYYLRNLSTDCIAMSFKQYFTEDEPYLTLKKK